MKAVFDRFCEANLTLKPKKCVFAKSEVKYLGHILSGEGVTVDPKTVEAVSQFPVPTTVKELQSFLGLATYYCRFCRSFADVAAPLTKLLRKDTPFVWRPGTLFIKASQHLRCRKCSLIADLMIFWYS